MGIKEVKIGTQIMFSSAARLQTAAWREGLAAAELCLDDMINLALQSGMEDQKCCACLAQSSDQRELAWGVEVLFKGMFMD